MNAARHAILIPVLVLAASAAGAERTFDLAVRDEMRHLIVNGATSPDPLTTAWERENARCETAVSGAFTNMLGRTTASSSPDDQTSDPLVRPEADRANVMAGDAVGTWCLSRARVGRSVTRVRAAYALGDQLLPPSDFGEVDWVRTYQESSALPGQADTFFFAGSGDLSDAAVYFACGGDAVTVVWCAKYSAGTRRETFRVSSTASARPYRLYRTDAPYFNNPVTFSKYYVKIVGSPNVLACDYATSVVTNADGSVVVSTNGVTRGVYLDATGKNLYCVGDVKGQFLLAYYDTADMTRLLDVEVVEACTPVVRLVSAVVGQELKPQADGYDVVGLYPEVVSSSRTTYDGRGDFIYVHGGASYSPHRNCAFAIRPTMDEGDRLDHTWDATINWYAPDEFGTEWPFEQTQYSIRWGTGVRMLVSGNPLSSGQMPVFPDGWTVELCGYQSPDAHVIDASSAATADEDDYSATLNWRGAGKSLLRVTGADSDGFSDVAFVQVDAVEARSIPETTTAWPVGRRVVPGVAGAAAVTNEAGVTWLGYIHEPWSALTFDADDYVAPSADLVAGCSTDDALSGMTVSDDGVISGLDDATVDENGVTTPLRSDIFFVNVPEKTQANQTDEIWWNAAVSAGDVVGTAYFPTYRECFRPVFPDPDGTEQIVLASGKGSSGVSVWGSVWHTNATIKADSLPHVYAGGTNAVDGTGRGWSPNVTHAWCRAGDGDYVCWAFRCDMKVHSELEQPFVYVKGEGTDANGFPERRVWFYYVLPTNAAYPKFEGDMLAGYALPGPHPFDLCEPQWMPETWWETPADHSKIVAYRDRKGAVWARRDGDLGIHMYYANMADFAYTYLENGVPREWTVAVPAGTSVPWNCTLVPNEPENTAKAGLWTWHAKWPTGVPTMRIAQTLTRTKNGVPEVYGAASAAVLWPEPKGISASSLADENETAQLVDPTCEQTASLDFGFTDRGDLLEALGFSSDPGGNCVYRDSLYYFRDLPGSIGKRLYYNPNADIGKCLVLKGVLDESSSLTEILYPNVLNDTERSAIRGLVPDENPYKAKWDAAVDGLATDVVIPSAHGYRSVVSPSGHEYWEFVTAYSPKDHYAITTPGGGSGATNYVVWVENDADPDAGLGVEEGDAVLMHVLVVVPEYYDASCVTRTDENNLLSQLLDVVYTDPLGGRPDDFYFQWVSAEPAADGSLPGPDDWRDSGRSGRGLTRFTLGTQGTLMDLVDTYYRVRYRAVEGSPAAAKMGTAWSEWTTPCLAEGWIQRVINSITPFTQRVTDLYDNPPETTVSMLRQIGGPYQGDVALNMDNIGDTGLLETYVTLLNKAESMSIAMGTASIDDTSVNKQLMELVERLDDFYALLGNEAFSDAANPTIACSDSDSASTFDLSLSSTFAFDNQVPTLLDEELALLRGRDIDSDEIFYRQAPCYNRLLWNYTRGITAGEVAYAMNYDTYATGDSIDIQASDAAAAYPQGHGDAWGHYLSGLKLWYRLLRNPSFSWAVSMGEMNVDDHPTNVDYFEEEKMAEAAAALGKTAQRVVDLTARKVWRDRAGAVSAADAGYEDTDSDRAFGYGEWANRGGVACFANWAIANSLLPVADTNETAYTDEGLLKINRSTVTALADLANRYNLIQRTTDRLNANLNPLGLADNAVPFGLSPAAADGSESQFEQSLASAEIALRNANALLEKAGESTARLRSLAFAEKEAENDAASEEASFSERLAAYYGYPYAGDIGVGKTYPQDYDGPDTVHWMYMDKSQTAGAENADAVYTVTYGYSVSSKYGVDKNLSYDYSRLGLVLKPDSVGGARRAWGSLQYAYSDYLSAISAYETSYRNYQALVESYEDCLIVNLVKTLGIGLAQVVTGILANKASGKLSVAEVDYYKDLNLRQSKAILQSNVRVSSLGNWGADTRNNYTLSIIGRAAGEVTGETRSELKESSRGIFQEAFEKDTATMSSDVTDITAAGEKWALAAKKAKTFGKVSGVVSLLSTFYNLACGVTAQITSYYQQRNAAAQSVIAAFNAIAPKAEQVLTLKAEAEAILDEREAARVARAQRAAKSRYSDMAHRLHRDEALDTYADAFDLAQKYTWLAAKAYDYETGGAITAGGERSEFLDEIIGTRLPGEVQADGSPMRWGGTGDAGLSDILARLKENYEVVKPRLGINNPQSEITWFSLRTEAFRILPGADGLNAWRNRLDTFRVSSLKNVPAYTRLCSTSSSTSASNLNLSSDEPALVIPLSTVIEKGKNFFGLDLAGGESRFSESFFATKIAEAGVELVGYDGSAFSATPYVYLVPAGCDMMRAPATGETISFDVADQVLPVPNILGSKSLDADWSELFVNLTGQTAGNVKVRKYPAFRARLTEEGAVDPEMSASTLIGRSVWNTEWVLIIPGSSLRADGDAALKEFIWGNGKTGGVSDIKIGFRTYSHWGQ